MLGSINIPTHNSRRNDRAAAMGTMARDLRERAGALLDAEHQITNEQQRLDAAQIDIAEREHRLRRDRARFEQDREAFETRAAQRERDREDAAAQAPLIAEHADAQHRALADQIVLAGKRRRNEIEPDQKPPRTASERLAMQIIEAGKKRRGEIV